MTRRIWMTTAVLPALALGQKKPRKIALRVRQAGEESERTRGYEFLLESDQPFPARALDPVLHVGDVALESYQYRGGNVLVFVTGEPAKLPQGAVVYFQYGNDTESRQDLGLYRGLTETKSK
jgi:hypothetical protein